MPMKIRTDLLSQFPYRVITESQKNDFLSHKEHLPYAAKKAFTRLLKVIDAFLYSTDTKLTLRAFNSEKNLNELFQSLISFVYLHIEGDKVHLYNISSYANSLFSSIAKKANIQLYKLIFSKRSISADVQNLIGIAKSVEEEKLEFYKGWVVLDKGGTEIDIELGFLREAYGVQSTAKIFEAFRKLCRTQERETAKTYYKHFKKLLEYLIKLAPTYELLEQCLERKVAVYYLSVIFNVELKKHLLGGGNGRSFCNSWRNKMALYEDCFVANAIFDKPLFALPVPKFKQSLVLAGSHNKSSDSGNLSSGILNNKLITRVPLKYTDNEVIHEVVKDIRRDIDHVLFVCEKAVALNYKRLTQYQEYSISSSAKVLGEVRTPQSLTEKRSIACATFALHLWDHPGKAGGYSSFLGFNNETTYITKLLCLPTLHILYPLLFQLIHIHPKITESWLLNWQLFDDNDKLDGFIESGNSFVIQSVKKRRGIENAQQVIKLTVESKEIVEKILAHTRVAREYLKSNGSSDYRYVLLTGALNSKPARLKGITNLNKITSRSIFTKLLTSGSANVSKQRAKEIAKSLSISRFRASSGVEVFLKTNSVKKMCNALGHKEPRDEIVRSYLPDSILRFFQDRWIRIFQNAIVFEAMKDSKYLHHAIDITPESLEAFLRNHKLKRMSGHIWDGNVIPLKVDEATLDGAIVISPVLLKILLFFFNAPKEDILTIALAKSDLETWTQLSTLIITQIECQLSSPNLLTDEFDEEIVDMYREAKKEPFSLSHFLAERPHEAS